VIVVLVAGLVAAGTWFYLSRRSAAPAAGPTAPAAAVAATVTTPSIAATELPPLAEMDPFVRGLLAPLGPFPPLLAWLATDDLVGSIAVAIDRMAQGQSPSRDLAVLRPAQGFASARRDSVTRVDPASYARYAPLARAVAGVEAGRLAAAFTTVRPRVAEAYARLGHPDGGFDDALRRAIEMVTSTPDVPADAALVPGAGGYAYADPAYERLPAAQKHLLRMGPEHVRLVRDAARRFAAALEAPAVAR
jgi:hypothetical protein